MQQPPDRMTIMHVLERAEVIMGEEAAEQLAAWLAEDWRYAAERSEEAPGTQGVWAAAQQLHRARGLRQGGASSLANMIDHLAEACISGWRDELTARTTEVPDHA